MSIITVKTSLYIRKSVMLGQKVHSHPFVWNNWENCPELSSSRPRLFGWYCNFAFTTAYWLFVVCQSALVNVSATESATQKVFALSVAILLTISVANQVTIAQNLDSFPNFVRHYTRYVEGLEETHGHSGSRLHSSRIPKLCELFVVGCYYLFLFYGLIWLGGAVLHHDVPFLLSSLAMFKSPSGVVVSILMWGYFLFLFLANASLIFNTALPWICSATLILHTRRYTDIG